MALNLNYSPFENVCYTPAIGQVWSYHDTNLEKKRIEWEITNIDGDHVTIVKLTGRDKGYKGETAMVQMFEKPWRFERGPIDTAPEYTFNCPGCDKPSPIPLGDYICKHCRARA